MKCLTTFVALALLSGCSAILGADFDHPAASSDGTLPDGGGELPNGEGGAAGTDAARTEDGGCAWADCKAPRPSNAGTFGKLPVSGSALTLESSASFSTTNDCKPGSILGECGPVLQTEGPAVCVCRFDTITIQDLTVTGARGLVLLAHGKVAITGTVDVAATSEKGGPGAETSPSMSPPEQSGLFAHGTAELVPLRGGVGVTEGGGGGGALQISSGTSIVIEPKGTIQAGGGGGLSDLYQGHSAGTGGAILLEAPLVQLEGLLLANGGGGGGGGSGAAFGSSGQDARLSGRNPAIGGSGNDGLGCPLGGYTAGGDGGHGGIEGVARTVGQPGDTVVDCLTTRIVYAGGTGGGVGRIRINAASEVGVQSSVTSFVSPAASRGIMPID